MKLLQLLDDFDTLILIGVSLFALLLMFPVAVVLDWLLVRFATPLPALTLALSVCTGVLVGVYLVTFPALGALRRFLVRREIPRIGAAVDAAERHGTAEAIETAHDRLESLASMHHNPALEDFRERLATLDTGARRVGAPW